MFYLIRAWKLVQCLAVDGCHKPKANKYIVFESKNM
jgi:hypothetical protein